MSKTAVVDPHHWIDLEGSLPASGPLRAKAVRVAQCIEYGGPLAHAEGRSTLIQCRFRPGGRTCFGFLLVIKQPDDSILAMCDTCQQEEFLIQNWQDMPWARGPAPAVHLDEAVDLEDDSTPAPPHYEADAVDRQLGGALAALAWNISAAEVREVISASATLTDVIRHLQSKFAPPPNARAMERFLPALMNAWNHTPRQELDGLTPAQKGKRTARQQAADPAAETSCPCGSGKAYVRCCLGKGGIN